MLSNKKRGQILIEILVAIGMFALVMVGIIGLMSMTKNISNLSIERLVAQGYVQDGIEKIRSIRDYNLKNGDPAFNDFQNGSVQINTDGNRFFTVSATEDNSLTELNSQGFKRIVEITGSGDTRKIVVTVSWNDGNKEIKAMEYLTNWKP